MEGSSSEEQIQMEVVTKLLQSVPNSPKCPADSLHKLNRKIHKRSLRSAFSGPTPTTNAAQCSSSESHMKKNSKITSKDQQRNRLVLFQEGGLPDGTAVVYKHGRNRLKGYKSGRGIFCFCCDSVISPSMFEAHAGGASRKKPYENIFLSDGVSLHKYALSLNVLQPSGNDLIDQIAKRDMRIVCNPDKFDLVACSICRAYDFSTVGFNDWTVLVCDQCEREYHIGCLRSHKKMDLKELPSGNWFCTVDCATLHSVLEKLVVCGPEKVYDFLMGSIRKISRDGNGIGTGTGITDSEMKWIVLRGKDVSVFDGENRGLLTQAVHIFHECFNPILDSITERDFIPSMAYGQKMDDSDFTGVHCAMLTIDSKVVTAGMFRVFGAEIAELPLVATSQPNQGQGYFQLFFKCFEKLLAYLKIKKLVVPAAESVKSMWIDKFDFKKVTPRQLSEYRQTFTSMVAFQGTCLLEKEVPQGRVTFKDGVGFSLAMGE